MNPLSSNLLLMSFGFFPFRFPVSSLVASLISYHRTDVLKTTVLSSVTVVTNEYSNYLLLCKGTRWRTQIGKERKRRNEETVSST